MRCSLVALLVLCSASIASAQVIYAPVQFQYGTATHYFYGGTDPSVHRIANYLTDCAPNYGRVSGYAFVSGNIHTHREVSTERTRVYTDCIPYREASVFGFTATDAYNQANQSLPTYFRKTDLMYNAIVLPDSLYIPSQPISRPYATGEIQIKPYVKPATAPATQPKPILIIPKKSLEAPRASDKLVASAD